jgi:dethiobiotin synthetase
LSIINPVQFSTPVSPNIAAAIEQRPINLKQVINQCKELLQQPVDYLFFEGLGGWKVPLNNNHTTVDLAKSLNLPIILVIGIRVGCLNHALLTYEAIKSAALPIAGWVANVILPDVPLVDQHIDTLKQWLDAPYLGMIPYQHHFTDLQCELNISILTKNCEQ